MIFDCRLQIPSVLVTTPRVRVAVRAILRLVVYRQLVRLGDKPLETHDQQFF
jgi:hypothetical protein